MHFKILTIIQNFDKNVTHESSWIITLPKLLSCYFKAIVLSPPFLWKRGFQLWTGQNFPAQHCEMMKINETQTELDLTEREDSKETSFIFSFIPLCKILFHRRWRARSHGLKSELIFTIRENGTKTDKKYNSTRTV